MTTFLPPAFQSILQRSVAFRPIHRITLRYGSAEQPLIATSGTVTIDRRRDQWTTATLTVISPDGFIDQLTPLGAAVDIEAGVELIDGSTAMVPLATGLQVTAVDGVIAPNTVLAVQLADRAERVARWRFEMPFPVPPANLATVVNTVLNNRGLAAAVQNVGSTLQTERVFGLEAGTDPWTELVKLCEGLSYRLWIDRYGQPQLDQGRAGTERPVLIVTPNMSHSGRPANVVVARFEAPDTEPQVAIARDLDPASPTFVNGPYGPVTYFFASGLDVGPAGAQSAAESILEGQKYRGASWTWEVPFDPTLDPDDIASGEIAGRQVSVVVDAVTFDLFGNTTIEGREAPG